MKKLLVALTAALVLAGSAAAQQAIADGKWWKRPRIAQALALTPAQTSDLEKIFARSRPKLIDLKADFEKKQFDYQQAMTADRVDRKAVEAAVAAREQARARLQTELSLMELDMRQVLTPEQREKAQMLRAQIKERALERRLQRRDAESSDELPAAPRGGARRAPAPTP
ncbi:MAG TPA: periplasmic heavy metal sensor [Thermoanaerobaculia bacterium]|nr:periplasmic heavy metal sensor [Thermoanaerobaculia bacterium]